MENYNWMRVPILNGAFPGFGLRSDKTLQLIAVDDISAFAAIAFAHPEQYLGAALEISGDELTEQEIAAVFSRVVGREVQLARPPANFQSGDPDIQRQQAIMVTWFNEHGFAADIEALRRIHPALLTLETWARAMAGKTPKRCPTLTEAGAG